MLDKPNIKLKMVNKINQKKDKKRIWGIGILALLLVSAIVIFGVTIMKEGNVVIGYSSYLIAAVILVFAIFLVKRKFKSVKSGFPAEDERSKKVMVIAGYYTFLISIYYLLVLAWMSDDYINFRDPSQALGMGIFGIAIIFGITWVVINSKANPEAKWF